MIEGDESRIAKRWNEFYTAANEDVNNTYDLIRRQSSIPFLLR